MLNSEKCPRYLDLLCFQQNILFANTNSMYINIFSKE